LWCFSEHERHGTGHGEMGRARVATELGALGRSGIDGMGLMGKTGWVFFVFCFFVFFVFGIFFVSFRCDVCCGVVFVGMGGMGMGMGKWDGHGWQRNWVPSCGVE